MITIVCSIISFLLGATTGLVITCCCVVSGKADRETEEMYVEKR